MIYLVYLPIHTIPAYSDITTDTYNIYTYIQYILIMIYLLIPFIPTNTCNAFIFKHTYSYRQYLYIQAILHIPMQWYAYWHYLHIPTLTINTYTCMQYLQILRLHCNVAVQLYSRPPSKPTVSLNSIPVVKGLGFISNRQRRKEGTFYASELAGIEPTPPAQDSAWRSRVCTPLPTRVGGVIHQDSTC